MTGLSGDLFFFAALQVHVEQDKAEDDGDQHEEGDGEAGGELAEVEAVEAEVDVGQGPGGPGGRGG